jgi:hypothetical protein
VARGGDLVVSPGHGWDEYLGFYDGAPVETFPLVYYAGALGSADAIRRTLGERAIGRRVLLVRLTDDTDPMGWKELRAFGITRETVAALLPTGTRRPLGEDVEELVR